MAALSVSCIQQHEFAGGKYLKSIMFLEQTYQNSLENCAKTLLGFTSVCSVCRPLAVGTGTRLMPPLAPDASATSMYCPGLPAPVPQRSPERAEITVPWCRWCNYWILLQSNLEDGAIIKKSCSSCWSYSVTTCPVSIHGDGSLPCTKQVHVAQKVNMILTFWVYSYWRLTLKEQLSL